jgi:acetoin utilization protein AcuC
VTVEVGLVVVPQVRIYDHGPEHPLRPERVLLTWELIEATGLADRANVERLAAEPASEAEIGAVHTAAFIDATTRAGHGETGSWARFGYGPGDNPIFPDMHEAGALVCGASIAAAQAVWGGRAEHAFNAAGGLHHAMPSRASGFCVYDDPAVAIAWLLANGAERIAYVDVDVHHGDGVQAIFWDDPRVLTISIHQYGEWFFPGTGSLDERGGANAPGSAINVPLPAGTGDDAWLEAFRTIVPPAVERFGPDVLVTQLGCDTHHTDPLATLELTTRAYRELAKELHGLAHGAAAGRWLATGGGGYRWASVVPRAWTLYVAEMAGALDELPDALPPAWLELAAGRGGRGMPTTFSEPALGPGSGDDGARAVVAAATAMLGS